MEQEASRTITDPPQTLIRISILPDPALGFTQAVVYFESQADALRWLADPHPKVLSMYRLAPRMAAGNALAWREISYVPPQALGHFQEEPPAPATREG